MIAYKVDAWLRGGEGARWVELGVSPLNSFDAFNLKPDGEYQFRITPRNRYGWGESVQSGPITVGRSENLPDFVKILPGQLKVLLGSNISLECEVSDSVVYASLGCKIIYLGQRRSGLDNSLVPRHQRDFPRR